RRTARSTGMCASPRESIRHDAGPPPPTAPKRRAQAPRRLRAAVDAAQPTDEVKKDRAASAHADFLVEHPSELPVLRLGATGAFDLGIVDIDTAALTFDGEWMLSGGGTARPEP